MTSAIIARLTQNNMLTTDETTTLRNARGNGAFLTSLVRIFEDKTEFFFESCKSGVREILRKEGVSTAELDTKTAEKIMGCAYGVFYEADKFSIVPSLRLLLRKIDPDMLPLLGFKPLSEDQTIAKRVFVGFVSRYQILRGVDSSAFRTLCQEVETTHPTLFPSYFCDALLLEAQIASTLRSQQRSFMANYVQTNYQTVAECVRGIVFYLGVLANYPSIRSPLNTHSFYHLHDRNTQLEFAGGMAQGYAHEMRSAERHRELQADNTAVLSSNIYRFCLPLLSLIGVPVQVDTSDLNETVADLQRQLTEQRKIQSSIDGAYDQARKEAHAAVDKWRASIPQREITFGIQIGIPLK